MLSPKLVQDIVAGHFGLTRSQLLGSRRLGHIVIARHVAMLLCIEMLRGASLPRVGRWFRRDHTSVLHARERMRRKIAVDPKFAEEVEELRQIIIKPAEPAFIAAT
jgi:chromosomal replication initiator protein